MDFNGSQLHARHVAGYRDKMINVYVYSIFVGPTRVNIARHSFYIRIPIIGDTVIHSALFSSAFLFIVQKMAMT